MKFRGDGHGDRANSVMANNQIREMQRASWGGNYPVFSAIMSQVTDQIEINTQ